jgi:hypothetical protein
MIHFCNLSTYVCGCPCDAHKIYALYFVLKMECDMHTGFVHGPSYRSLLPRRWLYWLLNSLYRWPRSFFPRHMGDSLVYGLIAIRVTWCYFSVFFVWAVCLSDRGREDFKILYCLDVTFLKLIKHSFSKKSQN